MRSLAALALALALMAGASEARPPVEVLQQLGIPESPAPADSQRALQLDLAWLGLLNGPITEREDAATREALQRFTASLGSAPVYTLTATQRNILRSRARDVEQDYGFKRRNIDWVGASAILPTAILMRPDLMGEDWQVISYLTDHGANLMFQFDQATGANWSAAQALQATRSGIDNNAREDDAHIRYLISTAHSESFLLKFVRDETITNLVIGQRGHSGWRFFHMRYSHGSEHDLAPVIERVLRGLDLHHAAALTPSQRRAQLATANGPDLLGMPDWFRTMTGNGSGSIVSRNGHVLTNHHVVSSCARVTVNGAPAMVLGTDPRLDLALIQSDRFANRRPVRFREDNPKLGEGISVMGYPIFSMSQSMNFTRGYVSSTVGFKGARSNLQITAPVQPGNSGGPVLDFSGRQVGVVASKATISLQVESNVENLAWAIRGRQALSFLRRNGLRPIVEDRPTSTLAPDTATIASWRQVTVRIECHHY